MSAVGSVNRRDVKKLQDLPNVGPATARDLRALGIARPEQLVGRDPHALYETLCRKTGKRQDPCVLDVLLSVVRFMEGAPAKPWWAYTAERKRALASSERAAVSPRPAPVRTRKAAPARRPRNPKHSAATALARVRRIALALPGASERLSHGEPTWFAGRVFVTFANDHHHDGHIAIWLPAPDGVQAELIERDPRAYFRPPYVGGGGWVGVEVARVTDRRLAAMIEMAWELVATPSARKQASARPRR